MEEQKKKFYVEEDAFLVNYLDPERLAQIVAVARILSESTLIPLEFQGNPANCLLAVQIALRHRSDPVQTLLQMQVIHGRAVLPAQFQISVAVKSGYFEGAIEYETGSDKDNGAWCRAWAIVRETGNKKVGPMVSMKMAQLEGWLDRKGSKWRSMPGLMMRYRAALFLIRTAAPWLGTGMLSEEEAADIGYEAFSRRAVDHTDATGADTSGGKTSLQRDEDALNKISKGAVKALDRSVVPPFLRKPGVSEVDGEKDVTSRQARERKDPEGDVGREDQSGDEEVEEGSPEKVADGKDGSGPKTSTTEEHKKEDQDVHEAGTGVTDKADAGWPRMIDGIWFDSLGTVYSDKLHAWSSRENRPAVVRDGTFRARRGTRRQVVVGTTQEGPGGVEQGQEGRASGEAHEQAEGKRKQATEETPGHEDLTAGETPETRTRMERAAKEAEALAKIALEEQPGETSLTPNELAYEAALRKNLALQTREDVDRMLHGRDIMKESLKKTPNLMKHALSLIDERIQELTGELSS